MLHDDQFVLTSSMNLNNDLNAKSEVQSSQESSSYTLSFDPDSRPLTSSSQSFLFSTPCAGPTESPTLNSNFPYVNDPLSACSTPGSMENSNNMMNNSSNALLLYDTSVLRSKEQLNQRLRSNSSNLVDDNFGYIQQQSLKESTSADIHTQLLLSGSGVLEDDIIHASRGSGGQLNNNDTNNGSDTSPSGGATSSLMNNQLIARDNLDEHLPSFLFPNFHQRTQSEEQPAPDLQHILNSSTSSVVHPYHRNSSESSPKSLLRYPWWLQSQQSQQIAPSIPFPKSSMLLAILLQRLFVVHRTQSSGEVCLTVGENTQERVEHSVKQMSVAELLHLLKNVVTCQISTDDGVGSWDTSDIDTKGTGSDKSLSRIFLSKDVDEIASRLGDLAGVTDKEFLQSIATWCQEQITSGDSVGFARENATDCLIPVKLTALADHELRGLELADHQPRAGSPDAVTDDKSNTKDGVVYTCGSSSCHVQYKGHDDNSTRHLEHIQSTSSIQENSTLSIPSAYSTNASSPSCDSRSSPRQDTIVFSSLEQHLAVLGSKLELLHAAVLAQAELQAHTLAALISSTAEGGGRLSSLLKTASGAPRVEVIGLDVVEDARMAPQHENVQDRKRQRTSNNGSAMTRDNIQEPAAAVVTDDSEMSILSLDSSLHGPKRPLCPMSASPHLFSSVPTVEAPQVPGPAPPFIQPSAESSSNDDGDGSNELAPSTDDDPAQCLQQLEALATATPHWAFYRNSYDWHRRRLLGHDDASSVKEEDAKKDYSASRQERTQEYLDLFLGDVPSSGLFTSNSPPGTQPSPLISHETIAFLSPRDVDGQLKDAWEATTYSLCGASREEDAEQQNSRHISCDLNNSNIEASTTKSVASSLEQATLRLRQAAELIPVWTARLDLLRSQHDTSFSPLVALPIFLQSSTFFQFMSSYVPIACSQLSHNLQRVKADLENISRSTNAFASPVSGSRASTSPAAASNGISSLESMRPNLACGMSSPGSLSLSNFANSAIVVGSNSIGGVPLTREAGGSDDGTAKIINPHIYLTPIHTHHQQSDVFRCGFISDAVGGSSNSNSHGIASGTGSVDPSSSSSTVFASSLDGINNVSQSNTSHHSEPNTSNASSFDNGSNIMKQNRPNNGIFSSNNSNSNNNNNTVDDVGRGRGNIPGHTTPGRKMMVMVYTAKPAAASTSFLSREDEEDEEQIATVTSPMEDSAITWKINEVPLSSSTPAQVVPNSTPAPRPNSRQPNALMAALVELTKTSATNLSAGSSLTPCVAHVSPAPRDTPNTSEPNFSSFNSGSSSASTSSQPPNFEAVDTTGGDPGSSRCSARGRGVQGVVWNAEDNTWVAFWQDPSTGQQQVRRFPAIQFGIEGARKLAMKCRREADRQLNAAVRQSQAASCSEGKRAGKENGNASDLNAAPRSEVPGVYWYRNRNGWVAQWFENGKNKHKFFAASVFGVEGAKQKAIAYRLMMLEEKKLKGW